jgi:hypothetical protein
MFGVGGTSPRTKKQKIIWWVIFGVFALFVVYVVIKNGFKL